MDAVSLKLARNYTNEKLNSLPSNAPTKTVTFDGGIYSVGNDVVNGQISVTLKGNTYFNSVINGNFAQGLTGWHGNAATISAVNNILSVTGDGTSTSPYAQQITTLPINNKIYAIAKLKVTNSDCIKIEFRTDTQVFKTIDNPVMNTIYTASGIITNTSGIRVRAFHHYVDAITSNGKVLEVKDVMVIDLTSTFGAGNEPTIEECDQIFANWFDGTKSTNSARVKSVGKNLCPTSQEAWEQGLLSSTDGKYAVSNVNIHTPGYYLIPQGKISCSQKDKTLMVFFYDENKNYISLSSGPNITVPVNAKYARFCIISSVDITPSMVTTFEPQCEQGSTPTTYEPYKESSAIINLPEPLRSLPNGVKDELNVVTGVKTQRIGNKTNVASGTVINYADMATGGQFEAWGANGEYVVGAKGDTLAFTATSLTYQLAEPIVTKLPAQPPLQVFENGTVYVEPIGDASESTLPSVEMTIPTGNSNKFGVASHDYDGAAADWTLTNSESKCFLLAVSGAGGAANIIAPNRPGTMYAISNASGYAITIKKSGGTGVAVTNAKTVLVIHNGTDYTALTAEL